MNSAQLGVSLFSEDTLRFALLGAGTGSLVALVALGVVLCYRSSGVLNFASTAVGTLGAYLFYILRDEHGVNWMIALVLGLLSGAVLGGLTQVAVMRVLARTSLLGKLIATLGILTALRAFISLLWGGQRGVVNSILSTELVHVTDGITVTKERLIIIAAVIVLSVVMRTIYAKTVFGLATAAVAESPRVASANGWSPNFVGFVNFMIAGTMSAAAGIFLAPLVGLQVNNLIGVMLLASFAAALVGNFSSFGITVVAALLIGILQAELQLFQNDIAKALSFESVGLRGLPQVVPLLVVIVVAVVRGSSRPKRGEKAERLPLPGSGRLKPLALLVVVPVLAVIVSVPDDWADAFVVALVTAILLLSIIVVSGYAGQLSLAQLSLAGFGAWVAARLAADHGLSFELAIIAGMVATVLLGVLVALPAVRTRGVTLAVVTLALGQMLTALIFDSSSATGGIDGITVKPPKILGVDISPLQHPQRYAVFILVLFVLLALVVANVRRGVVGRRLIAVRSNERAAASLGVGVVGAKLYAFGLAAAIASIGGTMLAFRSTAVTFTRFSVFGSIELVLYAVLGGIGWIGGAVVGALLAGGSVLEKVLRTWLENVDNVQSWLLLFFGLSVLPALKQSADGAARVVAEGFAALTARVKRRREGDGRALVPRKFAPGIGRAPVTIEARSVTVRFGGVVALDQVSFDLRPGEVLGLIGPNGAGKTAMLDVLTGFSRPLSGEVLVDGRPITGWSPERCARAGIVRSWQAVELFEELSVRENLLIAADRHAKARYATDLLRPGRPVETKMMHDVVARLGLEPYLERRPSELSHGVSRLVGIARAMAAEPAVLMLDEPAAGLDVHESVELGETIRQIAVDHGIPILVVEHDVPMLMNLCNRIVVLEFGRVIASGTPAEIAADAEVVRAYLGEASDRHDAATPAGAQGVTV